MGIEVRESPVTEESFTAMKRFVEDYLAASVGNETEGGRTRWYPWHSSSYRFNHILNVVAIATDIARAEGANEDVVRVASLFHDVSKLEAEQDHHADAGARVAREFLDSHGEYPESFIEQVCAAIRTHSYQGDLAEVSLETRCLMEADLIDKVGANGMALILLRMGYESRTHMDAATMVGRVLERGEDVLGRVRSDRAESITHQRLKRVRWFREWLEAEIAGLDTRRSG